MIDKKVNAEEQVQRMKALMNYGLNESKQTAYSDVEYSKEAADGKLYGIIREGSKYYIKVAKNPKGNLVAENFDYIGGFRNRKDNMFESFASAQRYFVEKMMCINESVDDARKRIIAESWDLDAKKEVIEEGTKKMQAEIERQRQIMKNAINISEGKKCDMIGGCPKTKTIEVEEPKAEAGAPFVTVVKNSDIKNTQDTNISGGKKPMVGNKKATNESTEVPLSSMKDPDYMDKSHGTKIGNNSPFTDEITDKVKDSVAEAPGADSSEEVIEKESMTEEVVMHDEQDMNKPAPGVGDNDETAPFDEKPELTEDVEDLDDELEDDEVVDDLDVLDDTEPEDEVEDMDAEFESDDDGDEEAEEHELEMNADDEEEPEVDETSARLDALEDKLNKILDAINNMKYDDDDELYDDEEDEEGPIEDEEEEENIEVVESKSYKAMKKRMLNEENEFPEEEEEFEEEEEEVVSPFASSEESEDENNHNTTTDFAKHPAYQKTVMTTPANANDFHNGQFDMNDASVYNDKPYGISKGIQAPFEVKPESVENAITEAVMRELKKKLG